MRNAYVRRLNKEILLCEQRNNTIITITRILGPCTETNYMSVTQLWSLPIEVRLLFTIGAQIYNPCQ